MLKVINGNMITVNYAHQHSLPIKKSIAQAYFFFFFFCRGLGVSGLRIKVLIFSNSDKMPNLSPGTFHGWPYWILMPTQVVIVITPILEIWKLRQGKSPRFHSWQVGDRALKAGSLPQWLALFISVPQEGTIATMTRTSRTRGGFCGDHEWGTFK